MPEHVHLLVSEPERELLSTAVQALKISFARRAGACGFRGERRSGKGAITTITCAPRGALSSSCATFTGTRWSAGCAPNHGSGRGVVFGTTPMPSLEWWRSNRSGQRFGAAAATHICQNRADVGHPHGKARKNKTWATSPQNPAWSGPPALRTDTNEMLCNQQRYSHSSQHTTLLAIRRSHEEFSTANNWQSHASHVFDSFSMSVDLRERGANSSA